MSKLLYKTRDDFRTVYFNLSNEELVNIYNSLIDNTVPYYNVNWLNSNKKYCVVSSTPIEDWIYNEINIIPLEWEAKTLEYARICGYSKEPTNILFDSLPDSIICDILENITDLKNDVELLNELSKNMLEESDIDLIDIYKCRWDFILNCFKLKAKEIGIKYKVIGYNVILFDYRKNVVA